MKARRQLILYILVGMLNTLFGYSVYAICIYIGIHYTLAALISTCCGVLFNFKTTGSIVFNNFNNRLLPKFLGTYAFLYCMNIMIIKLLQPFTNNYVAGFVAVIFSAAIGFIINKYLVFKEIHEAH